MYEAPQQIFQPIEQPRREWSRFERARFDCFKMVFDRGLAILLLVPLGCAMFALFLLNPVLNRGSLFFVQDRMGKDGKRFRLVKFRTMRPASGRARGPDDPLETDRITPLGRFLRKSRVDELPQAFNILAGQMSFIGPRPDMYDHAVEYSRLVPGYAQRFSVLPGISGFAQTKLGYIEGIIATRRKVAADLYYISHQSIRLDLWIAAQTIKTIVCGRGA